MVKILSTLGPQSEGKGINFLLNKSHIVRLNMSHNTIEWHKKIIKKIKLLEKNKLILVDVPGVKPRTLNLNEIQIKKGDILEFAFDKKNKKFIELSNPIPKINKKIKFFSLSDGLYRFRTLEYKKNYIKGSSLQNFSLKKGRGVNIPMSKYNDRLQEKKYYNFIKKISTLDFDCVGLSFVQNGKIVKKLKKHYPKKLFISKIENLMGYKNRLEIISNSDAIMIDRGDLAAEVGLSKLSEFTDNIISDSVKSGKPVIIATENLNSLIYGFSPSKSDVVNLDYYISKKVDYIMLSDETATSLNWKNTLNWLNSYLNKKFLKKTKLKKLSIEEISKNLMYQNIILFSKKGYFFDKISNINFNDLIVFTENKLLQKKLQLRKNSLAILIKFPKKNLHEFLYKNIEKYKKIIFKNNNFAYLINVIFPRKNSKANSISVLEKKDFFNEDRKN